MALESRHWKHHTTEIGWSHCKLVCNPCQQWSHRPTHAHQASIRPRGPGGWKFKAGTAALSLGDPKNPNTCTRLSLLELSPQSIEERWINWSGGHWRNLCSSLTVYIWVEQRWPLHSLDWNWRKCLTLSISWEKKGTVNTYLERLEEWSLWVLPTKTLAATTIPKLNIFLVDGGIDGFKQQQVWQQQQQKTFFPHCLPIYRPCYSGSWEVGPLKPILHFLTGIATKPR